jgi:LysR family transcriptional regulator, transcription activator of glutamate synthase operon
VDIQQLRHFKVIAELEHMTRASERLHVAQPALSKTIRLLEEELHVKLFDRKGKNIHLNDNGRILLKYTNQIIQNLDNAKKEIIDNNNKQKNVVTITMQAASKLLPSLLLAFKKENPSISFVINQHNGEKIIESDLVISSTKGRVHAPNLVNLLEEEILLAVPKWHPLARRDQIFLEEVSEEKFISLQKGMGLSDITTYYCQLAGFEPNIVLESDDPATIRGFISVGLGIAFLPSITWRGGIDENIKLLTISDFDCKRFINLSWKEGTYQTKAFTIVCNYIVDYFRKLK